MSNPRGWVQPAPEPPDVVESERLEATLMGMDIVPGKWGEQYQFDLELANGYKIRTWMKYYDTPNENTDIGKLGIAIQNRLNVEHECPEESLNWLLSYGRVYVECTGFRTANNGNNYPKFKIVPTLIPKLKPVQTTHPETEIVQ